MEKRRQADYSLAWQTRYILAGFGGDKNVSHFMEFYRELQPGDSARWEAYQKMLGREAADARELQQRMLDSPAVAAYAKSKGKTVHCPPGFD